jgi:hypothetical protein
MFRQLSHRHSRAISFKHTDKAVFAPEGQDRRITEVHKLCAPALHHDGLWTDANSRNVRDHLGSGIGVYLQQGNRSIHKKDESIENSGKEEPN